MLYTPALHHSHHNQSQLNCLSLNQYTGQIQEILAFQLSFRLRTPGSADCKAGLLVEGKSLRPQPPKKHMDCVYVTGLFIGVYRALVHELYNMLAFVCLYRYKCFYYRTIQTKHDKI